MIDIISYLWSFTDVFQIWSFVSEKKKQKTKTQENINVLFLSKPQSCLGFLEILEI